MKNKISNEKQNFIEYQLTQLLKIKHKKSHSMTLVLSVEEADTFDKRSWGLEYLLVLS